MLKTVEIKKIKTDNGGHKKFHDIDGNDLQVGYTTTYSAYSLNTDGILWVENDGRHVYQALVVSDSLAVEIRGDGGHTYPFPISVLRSERILNNINFLALLGICIG